RALRGLASVPTRRSSDLGDGGVGRDGIDSPRGQGGRGVDVARAVDGANPEAVCSLREAGENLRRSARREGRAVEAALEAARLARSEEHTSELQSRFEIVC